ncbi:MAG: polymerase sigma factor [Frankiales bacterium]|nr:polymerase sigma factor [Frankiales bacterium]
MSTRLTPGESATLVRDAAGGDRHSWELLVDSYAGLIWTIARNHRLGQADAGDVSQTTWLRLVEHIGSIDDPARVGAWLATTARRECLRVIGRGSKTFPVADAGPLADGRPHHDPEIDAALLGDERDAEVQRALLGLSPRCRQLLHLLMLDPPASYDEISAAMGMPIGSIGPTRGRCLDRLQGLLAMRGIAEPARSVLDGDSH